MITRYISHIFNRLRAATLRLAAPPPLQPMIWLLTRRENRDTCCRRSPESFSSLVRLYAHAVEKSVYAPHFDPQRGTERARHLQSLVTDAMAAGIDAETLGWARTILALYESRRKSAIGPPQPGDPTSRGIVDIGTLEAFASSRRSVRVFDPRSVPEADLARVSQVVRWAPTSCDRQSIKIFVTLNPERAKQAHACCVGRSGFGEHIPAFASFCADSNAYNFPDEILLPYVDAAICFSFFLLACHALGIGAAPMAWLPGRSEDESRLRGLLYIPTHYLIAVNCTFGMPVSRPPKKPGKPLSQWYEIID